MEEFMYTSAYSDEDDNEQAPFVEREREKTPHLSSRSIREKSVPKSPPRFVPRNSDSSKRKRPQMIGNRDGYGSLNNFQTDPGADQFGFPSRKKGKGEAKDLLEEIRDELDARIRAQLQPLFKFVQNLSGQLAVETNSLYVNDGSFLFPGERVSEVPVKEELVVVEKEKIYGNNNSNIDIPETDISEEGGPSAMSDADTESTAAMIQAHQKWKREKRKLPMIQKIVHAVHRTYSPHWGNDLVTKVCEKVISDRYKHLGEKFNFHEQQRIMPIGSKPPKSISDVIGSLKQIGVGLQTTAQERLQRALDGGFIARARAYAQLPHNVGKILLENQTVGWILRALEVVREASGMRNLNWEQLLIDDQVSDKFANLCGKLAQTGSGASAYQGPVRVNQNGGVSRSYWISGNMTMRRTQAVSISASRKWFRYIGLKESDDLKELRGIVAWMEGGNVLGYDQLLWDQRKNYYKNLLDVWQNGPVAKYAIWIGPTVYPGPGPSTAITALDPVLYTGSDSSSLPRINPPRSQAFWPRRIIYP